jgi:hypothetical protein
VDRAFAAVEEHIALFCRELDETSAAASCLDDDISDLVKGLCDRFETISSAIEYYRDAEKDARDKMRDGLDLAISEAHDEAEEARRSGYEEGVQSVA